MVIRTSKHINSKAEDQTYHSFVDLDSFFVVSGNRFPKNKNNDLINLNDKTLIRDSRLYYTTL